MALEVKRKLKDDASMSFNYIILAILFLIIRRIVIIFVTTEIIDSVPYIEDALTLILAIFLFLAVWYFYKAVRKVHIENKFRNFRQKSASKGLSESKPKKSFVNGYLDLTQ